MVPKGVALSSGTMTSYVNLNENWIIASWVIWQSERDKSLDPMYHGLAKRSSVTLRSERVMCTDMGEPCSSTCSRLSSKCLHLDVSEGNFTTGGVSFPSVTVDYWNACVP